MVQQRDRTCLFGLLVVTILLLGCSPVPALSPTQGDVDSQTSAPTEQDSISLGQRLPISAQFKVANQIIQLEVARTGQQQALGLMYRTKLADNRGMLFPFNPPRQVGFWMKNVAIHLDMVFLKNGRVVAISANVPPCTADPCPTYGPLTPVDQVIELRGGRAAELGIRIGQSLPVQYF